VDIGPISMPDTIPVAMALAALAEVPLESEVASDSTQGLLYGLERRVFGVPERTLLKLPPCVQHFHFALNVAPRLDFYPAT